MGCLVGLYSFFRFLYIYCERGNACPAADSTLSSAFGAAGYSYSPAAERGGQRSEIGGRKAGVGGQRMKERCSPRITRMGVNEKNAEYACLWHSA